MLNSVFGNTDFLKRALDGSWNRMEAISSNIANVNTPGYKKMVVDFENVLMNEIENKGISLSTTHGKHISKNSYLNGSEPFIRRDMSGKTRRDGNNVNIDVETADLAKNTIMYNSLIKQISRQFNTIETVINEGGK
ncbi:flagellar basal body rod protein FlgB [Brassicibacter mesophilus]|uniref:flagellar basal body rod protein FlgB n=1 Tax=Brassicibacter mesophilus TaxID=745119 RepID=UPI003D1EF3F5